ncbi:MAG TPA: ABC transporter permease [Blastocatellia bacterium]|nr:ABC transporter permease [Blastocatellia bacterium]
MNTLLQDVRYALRMLVRNPGFTAAAVIALALGIGANTAIFSVVNSMLLRPLPFKDSENLLQVWETQESKGRYKIPASYPNFKDWKEQSQVFEDVIAYTEWSFNLTGAGEPERIKGAIVSPAFFSTLGLTPILGRDFLPEEDQAGKNLVAVLGETLWHRRFNSDPAVIGRSITLGGKSFTVIGVVARGAQVPVLSSEVELFAPVTHGFALQGRAAHYLSVIARLKDGVAPEQAEAEMATIAGRLAEQYPDANASRSIRLVPLLEEIVGDFRLSLGVLLGAVLFVLLIASANVANMLLARATTRRKEIAIRSALGAGRSRLIRQLLTESVLLALVGGTLGLLLALWGVDSLAALSPADVPRIAELGIDGRVLLFTFSVSLLTGVLFGLFPAFQASRFNLNETLKEGGRSASGGSSRHRVRSLLVISEVALSIMLLAGAGLLIRSFILLQKVDPGFNSAGVLTMQINLSPPRYTKAAPVLAFHKQILDRVKSIPGVQSATTRSAVPLGDDFSYLSFMKEGVPVDPADRPVAFYNAVGHEYFDTMQIPVIRGRQFDERDVRGTTNVAIINETLAERFFAGEDPLGRRITLNDEDPKEEDWATIVGIVRDTKSINLDDEPAAETYMPYAQQPEAGFVLMIRAGAGMTGLADAVRKEVLSLDPEQPVHSIKPLDRVKAESIAAPRFRTLLLGLFAALAMLLAAVGIYSVMSYSVAQRSHEFGIRMALGAKTSDVLKMVLRDGLALTIAGMVIGLAASFALTRWLSSLLFKVEATDPITFVAVSLLIVGVALTACFVPARRATRVDPIVALRYE